jgi:hypothetical protein
MAGIVALNNFMAWNLLKHPSALKIYESLEPVSNFSEIKIFFTKLLFKTYG